MSRTMSVFMAAALLLPVYGSAEAQPYGRGYWSLGGVNLNYYCSKTFGAEFKSVLVGTTAGDWTCQRNQTDRRPISVADACKLQYGRPNLTAKALDWNDPGSWHCLVSTRGGRPY